METSSSKPLQHQCLHVPSLAQRGISLLELMVGITIGMLVVLAALGTVFMTKASSVTVSDSARLEQETNMVMQIIAEQVRQAGAINVVSVAPPAAVASAMGDDVLLPVSYEDFAGLNGAGGLTRKIVLSGTSGTDTDSITFTYAQPKAGAAGGFQGVALNCAGENAILYPTTGTPAAQSTQVVSTLQVTAGNLTCGTPGGTPQPLASNVAEFKVRYLRNNGNTAKYQTAAQIESSGADWTGIDGIEICLHITGEASNAATTAPNAAIRNCEGSAIANDGRLHRVARNVFQLRNSMAL